MLNKPKNEKYILRGFDENLYKVLKYGHDMVDRTGVGCRYLPGITTEIDISERVPVPTLRATKWKSMLAEYLWFLTGSDRISDLEKMGSKVWNYWKNPVWATNNNLPADSIGYGYGPNLINFGGSLHDDNGKYIDDVKNRGGFNQIDYIIGLLKSNPDSRRIMFSFFRPDKHLCVLPPCHQTYQFIPEPNNRLSCVVYIRSNDLFVGALSTNLQGAAFYTYMIGQQTGFHPNKLIVCSAHAHI